MFVSVETKFNTCPKPLKAHQYQTCCSRSNSYMIVLRLWKVVVTASSSVAYCASRSSLQTLQERHVALAAAWAGSVAGAVTRTNDSTPPSAKFVYSARCLGSDSLIAKIEGRSGCCSVGVFDDLSLTSLVFLYTILV